jgi:alpha-L-fucosidase
MSTLNRVSQKGPFHPSDTSLDKRAIPEWYKKAKFGIYFHWLIASAPAYEGVGCWYGNNMYIKGNAAYQHQIDTYGPLSKYGYKDFIPHLTGSQYNADQYAELFKQAGAKFVAEVVDFHDGFPMYKTSLTPWNAVQMGPKRDVYGELANAVKKRGMKLGFAWHGFEHWGFFYPGTQIDSDVRPPYSGSPWSVYGPAEPFDKPLSQAFIQDCMGRLVEIVDQYHPDLAWFDFDDMYVPRPDMRKWLSFYYNRGAQWGRQVVDTDKIQPLYAKSCVLDLERGQTDHILPETWMEDTSVSWKDWSYIRNDQFKTDGEIIHELIDDTSKNGIMLLDIGPRPDGSIPAEPRAILQSIGRGLKINGNAIYGSTPCYILGFGEGPHLHTGGGAFSDEAVEYNSHDFRFTQKGNTIFAIAMDWPRKGDDFLIHSFAANRLISTGGIASVSLLGSNAKLGWKVTPEGLRIKCPIKQPCEHAYAFQITLRGAILEQMNARRLGSRQVKIYSEWWNPQSTGINQSITFFHNGHAIRHAVLHIAANQKTHYTIMLNASLQSQSNIEDFSAGATGKTGTLASCQIITPPATASCIFDGKTVLKGSGLGTLPQLTISLWVKPMKLSEDYSALLNTDSWDTGSMHFQLLENGEIELALGGDGQSDTSLALTNGEWANVAATVDTFKRIAKVYVNGVLEMQIPLSAGNPVHLDKFHLGSWAGNSRFLNGDMADVRIYNRVLTSEEINGLVSGIEPMEGLAACWNSQSSSEGNILDASGNGHDLVVNGIKN